MDDLRMMAEDLTRELHAWGLKWKKESRKILGWGGANPYPITLADAMYQVPVKEELELLGLTIPHNGSMREAQNIRANAATGAMHSSNDT